MSPGSSPSARARCWRPRFERCRNSPTCCWSTPRGAITHAAPVSHFILARSSSDRPLASPTGPCWLVENGRRRRQAHAVHWCSAKRWSAAGCGHVSARDHWQCTRPGGPTSTPPAPSCSPPCIACERPSHCARHAASRDALGRICRPGPTAGGGGRSGPLVVIKRSACERADETTASHSCRPRTAFGRSDAGVSLGALRRSRCLHMIAWAGDLAARPCGAWGA